MRRPLALALFIVVLFLGQSASTVLPPADDGASAANARGAGEVRISEILVSASSAEYNGTDWNNDGDIGSISVSYTHLTLPTKRIV